jgi:hypothetical protein
MKFRNRLECEIDIDFVDLDKAKAYFIGSDWAEDFFEFEDIEDLAEHLSFNFHQAREILKDGLVRFVEGIGEFVYSYENKEWRLTDKYLPEGEVLPCGDIVIRYESELQSAGVEELDD